MVRTASDILEQEFLQARAKLLELAAFFDRLDEASKAHSGNSFAEKDQQRLKVLQASIDLLGESDGDKAARLQLLFSREYDSQWREQFGLPTSR